jgi:hypothetical protein
MHARNGATAARNRTFLGERIADIRISRVGSPMPPPPPLSGGRTVQD